MTRALVYGSRTAHWVGWAQRASKLAAAIGILAASSACRPPRTIQVSNTGDGGKGTLRNAIDRANRSRSIVTIEIAPGTYELTRCGADDRNRSGDLDLTTAQPVTLMGTGQGVVIRQTCPGERVLDALGPSVLTLKGVTITGGSAVGSSPEQPAQGGGVRARGDVYLERTTLTENSLTGASGNLGGVDGAAVDAGPAYGGGLYVEGALVASASVLASNTVTGGASALEGGAAEGGGAYAGGRIVFRGGSITSNRANGGDGAAARAGTVARGGGLAQRTSSSDPVLLSGTELTQNVASGERFRVSRVNAGVTPESLGPGDALGGALASAGPLDVESVTATANSAHGGSTNDICSGDCSAAVARGGVIAASSTASIRESTFSRNGARSGSGPVQCGPIPTPTGCQGAAAAPAAGGAVWTGGALSVSDGTFSENSVEQGLGIADLDGAAHGGAVTSSGELTISGGQYAGNAARRGYGGAISGSRVAITGATFVGNTAQGRGGAIDAATLEASALVASQNSVAGSGGGAIAVIGDASFSGSTLHFNTVSSRQVRGQRAQARGGAVMAGGHLTLFETSLIGNTGAAQVFGGGQACPGGCPATFAGGAISTGSLEADRVTFAQNHAAGQTFLPGGPEAFPPGRSGGGAIAASGSVSLRNATLVANSTSEPVEFGEWVAAPEGAAVFAGEISLDHVTMTDNLNAPTLQGPVLTAHRSIVVASAEQPVCAASTRIAASSFNWFNDASCGLFGAGDRQESAAFLLGPLTDNGGPVLTRLPGDASVLRDWVPISACPVPEDARGVLRPQGAGCDVGAVEIVPISGRDTDLDHALAPLAE